MSMNLKHDLNQKRGLKTEKKWIVHKILSFTQESFYTFLTQNLMEYTLNNKRFKGSDAIEEAFL